MVTRVSSRAASTGLAIGLAVLVAVGLSACDGGPGAGERRSGAVANQSGETLTDGERRPTSMFRLLWGFFETKTTARGSSWRLFWIPFGG